QCVVDWRKAALTNSDNYARLKRSSIELLGVFCTPKHHLIEVAPDMHNKFIIFGDEECIIGSFNITFERWWSNWESGMTFRSHGVCRLLDNIFQSMRGGTIQRYGIDPYSGFNLLYTFGRHTMLNGRNYRPHHAIISEIHRANQSIRAGLFLLGELRGDHGDSVVDALAQAKRRGVDVQILFNGHMARACNPAEAHTMRRELETPLLPAISRLKEEGVSFGLAYGLADYPVPYSPLHSKFCVIDERIVLDGSFNWYNTSVFSHDLIVVLSNPAVAKQYLYEYHLILNRFRVFWP
ncbi:MAG: phospholipase D family protein, partial [Desulfobacteraceae bacterium]|nr:phospholipase D family protein [Desulfobacteraceae bacterium]